MEKGTAAKRIEQEIKANDFETIKDNVWKPDVSSRKRRTYWSDVLRTFCSNKIALVSLFVLAIIILMVIIGPHLNGFDYKSNDYSSTDMSPDSIHWFGTDSLGRDLWVRVWMGGRVSLLIAVFGTIIPYAIGIIIGGISGYIGGKFDAVMMRIIDILMGVPSLIYMILLMMVMGSGNILTLVIAVTVTGWLSAARMTRGLVLQVRSREYVLAAKTLGVSDATIIAKHLIPNTLGIVIVSITMDIPAVIFYEAFLSFIGLGVTPPAPSWGQLIKSAAESFRYYPYQFIIPCLCVSLTMLCFNFVGDGIRDALDPKLRSQEV